MSSETVKLLCIGVAKSKIAKNCPGADLDALRMFEIISAATEQKPAYSKALISEEATAKNVEDELLKVCSDNDGLAIIFYAGHGASQRVKYKAEEEADGKDEYILLYDNYMLDDQIWNIVSTAQCRVFMIFDCCHSETMFRFAKDIVDITRQDGLFRRVIDTIKKFFSKLRSFRESKPRTVYYLNKNPQFPELLCWSGCADDKVSYGNSSGGLFTSTILKYLAELGGSSLTYESFWSKLASDSRLNTREVCKRTLLPGTKTDTFDNRTIFS